MHWEQKLEKNSAASAIGSNICLKINGSLRKLGHCCTCIAIFPIVAQCVKAWFSAKQTWISLLERVRILSLSIWVSVDAQWGQLGYKVLFKFRDMPKINILKTASFADYYSPARLATPIVLSLTLCVNYPNIWYR